MSHHQSLLADTSFRELFTPARERAAPETRRSPRDADAGQPLLAIALDLLRISVMLTDGDGQLLYANRQARQLLSQQRGLRVSLGRLSAANPKCAARLREAIQLCTQAKYAQQRPLGIAVPIPQSEVPNIAAWVHPAAGSGHAEPQAAIFIRNAADLFSGDVFAATFGATQAEVRVLKLLFDGLSIAAVCARLALSRNTVRTHVKSLFAKTGARRQAELISLAATAIAPASTLEPDAA
jgi:DNA-binding CsgD family transcriptional regulator